MSFFRGPNIVNDELVLYLDSVNFKSFNGGTTWYDLSGRNNHATLINTSYNENNLGSIYFDGIGYASIQSTDDFNFENKPFSMSFWLNNLDTNLNWNRIISKKTNSEDYYGWDVGLFSGNSSHLYVAMGYSFPYGDIDCVNWIGTGWHNIVINYNSYEEQIYNILEIWCDGIYKGTTTNLNKLYHNNDNSILIGKNLSEDMSQWYGYISVVQIYNKWLTQNEILNNFNSFRGRYNL